MQKYSIFLNYCVFLRNRITPLAKLLLKYFTRSKSLLRMTLKEISQYQIDVNQMLDDDRLYESIMKLKPLVDEVADYDLTEHFTTTKVSYDYLLQYLIAGVKDEGREQMLSKIAESLYTILDKCVIALSSKQSFELFYTKASVFQNVTIDVLVKKYQSLQRKSDLLSAVPADTQNVRAISSLKRDMENVATDIFNKVWSQYPLTNDDADALSLSFADLPEYVKQLVVSALFLGNTKFYDETKLVMLLKAYIASPDSVTQTRALTGALITMMLYSKRVSRSVMIENMLAEASDCTHFKTDVVAVMQRLVRSQNAENVSKLMRDDLMPGIMNMDPGLMSKLKEKRAIDPSELEGNPQWQEWLDKSGVSKKMEELNKLQSEGEDVFISTFSHLKSFPFFNTMANWFLPFYAIHSSLDDAFPADSRKMLSVIKLAPFLCDSDKYSFCFSLASVPDAQKNAMLGQMDLHNADLHEIEASELPDDEAKKRDGTINNYIQSLYRFFTLFSRRNDFRSVFSSVMDFTRLPFLGVLGLDKSSFHIIAEYYLSKGFYREAILYFEYIQKTYTDVDPLVVQKTGFAYQNLGDYKKALLYYQRYELVNDSSLWNDIHIATCYRQLRQFEQALTYYEKALKVKDGNATLCLNAGHCLLELNRAEDAINYYYKADYLDSSNPKVWRSLAWANFLVGHFKQSDSFYKKLSEHDFATPQDYLNYGHLRLVEGQLEDAVNFYAKSGAGDAQQLSSFISAYNADIPTLVQKGVDPHLAGLVKEATVKKITNS